MIAIDRAMVTEGDMFFVLEEVDHIWNCHEGVAEVFAGAWDRGSRREDDSFPQLVPRCPRQRRCLRPQRSKQHTSPSPRRHRSHPTHPAPSRCAPFRLPSRLDRPRQSRLSPISAAIVAQISLLLLTITSGYVPPCPPKPPSHFITPTRR